MNAFKTLVKNKIMHRDFKLANILKHNGIIKIADFGFAKILGDDTFTTTMLGSPLNMAPGILGGKDYNSKADIWSIGTCIYELLFGKPPYTAKNIVELLQKIQKTPFALPPNAKISPVLEDALKRMLVFNPDDRIEWDELFSHKITKLMEEKIMLDLEETIKHNDINNISKFYIKNNKVIDHVVEIEKRKDINEFAMEAVKNSTRGERNSNFKGNYVNRNYQRDQEEHEVDFKQAYADNNVTEDETEREKMIRTFKYNSSRILHERNKYVFRLRRRGRHRPRLQVLRHDRLHPHQETLPHALRDQVLPRKPEERLRPRILTEYLQTKDYRKICNYINKEFELFKNYYENLNQTIIKKFHAQDSKNPVLERLIKAGTEDEINAILKRVFKDYIDVVFQPRESRQGPQTQGHLGAHQPAAGLPQLREGVLLQQGRQQAVQLQAVLRGSEDARVRRAHRPRAQQAQVRKHLYPSLV